jgi:hypothetical protein
MSLNKTQAVSPDEKCLAEGGKYLCQIDRGKNGHTGVVRDEKGSIRWKYGARARANGSGRSIRNPFGKPDFVINDIGGQNEIVIRRASFIPPAFMVMEERASIGRIRLTTILRNRYEIMLSEMQPLTFRMPLFTVRFWGGSKSGPEVWVAVGPSKMEWSILVKPGLDDRHLIAVLSFIHVEWWNFS